MEKIIKVRENECFQIELEALSSAGFNWEIIYDEKVILICHKYKDPEFDPKIQEVPVGGPTTQCFVLMASEDTEIVFNYKRPWENHVEETKKFKVIVS